MNYLKVGTILKTRGLKGEVRIYSTTSFARERFKKGNKLYLKQDEDYIELTIKAKSNDGTYDLLTFEGYETIEAVTPFLKHDLYIIKEEHPLKKGYYYFSDLNGCTILNDGLDVGIVINVEEYNGLVYLRIKTNHKDLLLPFNEAFIKKVDIEQKRIDVSLIEGMLE